VLELLDLALIERASHVGPRLLGRRRLVAAEHDALRDVGQHDHDDDREGGALEEAIH